MRMLKVIGMSLLCLVPMAAVADVLLDGFENDRSALNGPGTDAYWNLPPAATFQVAVEKQKVSAGTAALKVTWENKDLWPNFVLGQLDKNSNTGNRFGEADALRMAIAGPGGNIILKLVDTNGTTTGDLASVTVSGGDDYQVYEFPYFSAAGNFPIDLTKIAEIWLLVDAGKSKTSGTIYIDSIELIAGTGTDAQVVAVVDNFDNDGSIEDDPNAPDSKPSGYSLMPGPYVTSVVDDPAGSGGAALKVDYNTSPWNVLWVGELDVTDWSWAEAVTLDIYGTAGGILLKLKDADGAEQEPSGGTVRHDGNQWDTFTWGLENATAVDLTRMGRLIVFVEGPTGGTGTVYFDNLKLIGPVTRLEKWELY
ncbi:MAG TPA: hypothetical protein PK360_00405 [bacterium]|nr:hypothetical protein [bacterium]